MRFIGVIISLLLLFVLIAWLAKEAPKLITPEFRSIFNFSTSTYSYGVGATSTPKATGGNKTPPSSGSVITAPSSASPSPYAGKVAISTVGIGTYSAVVFSNNSNSLITVSGWHIAGVRGKTAISAGSRRGGSGTSAEGTIILQPGESAVIYEGVHNEAATALYPNAAWYAWTGTQFLEDHDTLRLLDEQGREVARYSY